MEYLVDFISVPIKTIYDRKTVLVHHQVLNLGSVFFPVIVKRQFVSSDCVNDRDVVETHYPALPGYPSWSNQTSKLKIVRSEGYLQLRIMSHFLSYQFLVGGDFLDALQEGHHGETAHDHGDRGRVGNSSIAGLLNNRGKSVAGSSLVASRSRNWCSRAGLHSGRNRRWRGLTSRRSWWCLRSRRSWCGRLGLFGLRSRYRGFGLFGLRGRN